MAQVIRPRGDSAETRTRLPRVGLGALPFLAFAGFLFFLNHSRAVACDSESPSIYYFDASEEGAELRRVDPRNGVVKVIGWLDEMPSDLWTAKDGTQILAITPRKILTADLSASAPCDDRVIFELRAETPVPVADIYALGSISHPPRTYLVAYTFSEASGARCELWLQVEGSTKFLLSETGGEGDIEACENFTETQTSQEGNFSARSYYDERSCLADACARILDASAARAYAEALQLDPDFDLVAKYSGAEKRHWLIYKIVQGDDSHILAPVLIESAESNRIDTLSFEYEQVRLQPREDLILLADEFTGAGPRVLDLGSGKIIWEVDGRFAFWWPREK